MTFSEKMPEITKDQFKSALNTDGVLKEKSIELLTILYDAPSCRATAGQIAQVFGYEDFRPVNALIGQLGKRIAHHLGIDLPERPSNSRGWWQIVATGEYLEEGFTWSLREDLFDALVELGLLASNESLGFTEIVPESDHFEGAVRQVTINAYERNKLARDLCIKHYGALCAVCKFDFQDSYGDIGSGFIHVHHLIELSEIGEEYRVDPINDLIPVCPNCHAMIHTKRPAMTIKELREVILQNRRELGSAERPSKA